MRRRALLFSPALLLWPQMALANVPGEGVDRTFVFPLLGALWCFALMAYPTLGEKDRDDRILDLFLAGVGLTLTVLETVVFLSAVQDLKADRRDGTAPVQNGGQP